MKIAGDRIRLVSTQEPQGIWEYDAGKCFAKTDQGEIVQVICSDGDRQNDFRGLRQKLKNHSDHVLFLTMSDKNSLTTVDDVQRVVASLYVAKDQCRERMKSVALQYGNFQQVGEQILAPPPCAPRGTTWHQFISVNANPSFVVPLLAEKLNDFLPDQLPYIPFPANPERGPNWGNFSCYRWPDSFPKKYKADLILYPIGVHPKQKKGITVILHGFISPSKLHGHFWKHVIGLTDTPPHHQAEAAQWQQLFQEISLPTPEDLKTSGCNYENNGCNHWRCTSNPIQFQKVNCSLMSGLSKYLEMAVDLFEKATTRELYMWKTYQESDAWELEVCIGGPVQHPTTAGQGESGYYDFLVLKGSCFDWQANEPVIHCHIATYFHKTVGQRFWPRSRTAQTNERKGSLSNVSAN